MPVWTEKGTIVALEFSRQILKSHNQVLTMKAIFAVVFFALFATAIAVPLISYGVPSYGYAPALGYGYNYGYAAPTYGYGLNYGLASPYYNYGGVYGYLKK